MGSRLSPRLRLRRPEPSPMPAPVPAPGCAHGLMDWTVLVRVLVLLLKGHLTPQQEACSPTLPREPECCVRCVYTQALARSVSYHDPPTQLTTRFGQRFRCTHGPHGRCRGGGNSPRGCARAVSAAPGLHGPTPRSSTHRHTEASSGASETRQLPSTKDPGRTATPSVRPEPR